MARTQRIMSETGIYHLMLRGVNKQFIFVDDEDRRFFVQRLRDYQEPSKIELFAYALMDNHVHLLVKGDIDFLGTFMGRLGTSYVQYFNKKYDRVGHLFQNRYKSLAIENEEYFLTAFRYIHQNPERAGFEQFSWTSYKEYQQDSQGMVAVAFARSLFGSKEQLLDYLSNKDDKNFWTISFDERVSDSEAVTIIDKHMRENGYELSGDVSNLFLLPRDLQKKMVRIFKESGLSIRQIERITGISRGIISRA